MSKQKLWKNSKNLGDATKNIKEALTFIFFHVIISYNDLVNKIH